MIARVASLAVLLALSVWADPVVFYSKSFPGSVPAYVSVELNKDGSAVYKEAPDDQEPISFKVPAEENTQIFDLVDKLEHFKRPLEANLKVANMGMKTFRYENGSEKHEVKFNFSLDENAKLLLDSFERLTETQQLLFMLERAVKFDRLGVNKVLLQVESAWDRGRLVGPDRFLTLLNRVVKNDSYLNMARERAAYLAESFRNPKPKPTPE
jgi:hypothetical protein